MRANHRNTLILAVLTMLPGDHAVGDLTQGAIDGVSVMLTASWRIVRND